MAAKTVDDIAIAVKSIAPKTLPIFKLVIFHLLQNIR
jgi:hypothetical protein